MNVVLVLSRCKKRVINVQLVIHIVDIFALSVVTSRGHDGRKSYWFPILRPIAIYVTQIWDWRTFPHEFVCSSSNYGGTSISELWRDGDKFLKLLWCPIYSWRSPHSWSYLQLMVRRINAVVIYSGFRHNIILFYFCYTSFDSSNYILCPLLLTTS